MFDAILGWFGLTIDDIRREILVAVLIAAVFAAASFVFGAVSRWLGIRRRKQNLSSESQTDDPGLTRKERRTGSVSKVASIASGVLSGLLAFSVVAFLAVVFFFPSSSTSGAQPAESVSALPSGDPTQTVAPTPTQTAPAGPTTKVSVLEGCPPVAAADSVDQSVVIDVLYWCTTEAYLDDGSLDLSKWMVKVRPMLRNASSQAVRISIASPSSVRLLVAGDNLHEDWAPPPVTAASGDRPISVICDGQQLWAIPPNSPAETYPIVGNNYLGHATYWGFESLAPSEVLYRPVRYDDSGRVVKEANLVFTVPVVDLEDLGVYGLAIVDPGSGDVLGVSRIDDWPSKVLPSTF